MEKFWLRSTLALLDNLEAIKVARESKVDRNPPEAWSHGRRGDVVLFPGWMENWSALWDLGMLANKLGFKVHTIRELGNNTCPLSQGVEIVGNYIIDNNLEQVIGASHSKGALEAWASVNNPEIGPRIDTVLTVSAPFKGTLLGLIPSLGIGDMAPNSKFFKEMKKLRRGNHKITNVYGLQDPLVVPNSSLILEDANANILLGAIGHMGPRNCDETMDIFRAKLTHARS
jgi:hypothetical protein